MTDTSTSLGHELAEDAEDAAASAPATGSSSTDAGTEATGSTAEPHGELDTSSPDTLPTGTGTTEPPPDGSAAEEPESGGDDKPKRGRPRKTAAKPKGIELVLTMTGSADGTDWKAEVAHGTRRVVKALPIPAAAVSAAAKDLHPDIAEAIEGVLSAAREQQRTRVEQLQAELEAAQRALADLQD